MKKYPIIGLVGAPGSGKSSLAKFLCKELNGVRIDMDEYQTFTDGGIDEALGMLRSTGSYNNFQVPQLSTDLVALSEGNKIKTPGGKELQATGPIIFETHFGRTHDDTGQNIDYLIWLNAPMDITIARKLQQFFKDFLNSPDEYLRNQLEWINGYLQSYEHGMREAFILQAEHIPQTADLCLDASQDLESLGSEAAIAIKVFLEPG